MPIINKMNILLINDTTNWYHFGCTATSTALINKIKHLGHNVTSVPILKTYEIISAPKTIIGFKDDIICKEFIDDNKEIINLIKNNDALVINGEGTLHGLNTAPVNLLYLAYITKTIFHKHVEILNHSVYPQHDDSIGNSDEYEIYKLVYNTIDFAAIREDISFNLMKKLGVTKIVQSFDCLPLYVKDYYNYHRCRNNIKIKTLLIAGSATWLNLNIPSNKKGNIDDFTNGLEGFNNYLKIMHNKGFRIQFLYGASSYPAKDDREFIEHMQQKFQVTWEIYEATTINDWLNVIDEASLLVSGRFHHTIAAITLGTKFIALNSNTPKMNGLMSMLKYPNVLQYNDLDICSKLLRLTETALAEKPNKINNYNTLEQLCAMANNNFLMLQ